MWNGSKFDHVVTISPKVTHHMASMRVSVCSSRLPTAQGARGTTH